MDPRTVSAILDTVQAVWPTANDLEVTLEANPTSVEAARFSDFHLAGVNRVSMGIQALNDSDLAALGRLHTAKEALAAFDIARHEFDRVSFDLMYGRQNQSLIQWESELSSALALGLDHVSLYQLTVENGTAFGDRYKAGKLRGLPDEDLSADMYSLTQDICTAHNMPRYEVSNHATDGNASRHNLIYWRYGDYVGIGPGAHGRITLDSTRWATEQAKMPTNWLAGENREQREHLSGSDQASEFLLMGLRLTEGVDIDRFAALSGHRLDQDKLDYLLDIGMIQFSGNRITVSNQGFTVLNAVLRELLAA
mmetsp:Transcript_18535/g.30415  ORF Transcript_18535/g.30415 Transcript_18535/m.30415 type:complete len:309 (+) Transcript_18535:5980-6906(+)